MRKKNSLKNFIGSIDPVIRGDEYAIEIVS